MALKAEDILLTHGTTEALSLAIRAVTKPGDIIAVETPTFTICIRQSGIRA